MFVWRRGAAAEPPFFSFFWQILKSVLEKIRADIRAGFRLGGKALLRLRKRAEGASKHQERFLSLSKAFPTNLKPARIFSNISARILSSTDLFTNGFSADASCP
jgi:hypothetical protein